MDKEVAVVGSAQTKYEADKIDLPISELFLNI